MKLIDTKYEIYTELGSKVDNAFDILIDDFIKKYSQCSLIELEFILTNVLSRKILSSKMKKNIEIRLSEMEV